jgi:hypothetical protein
VSRAGERQDLGSILGDGNRVFAVRSACAGFAAEGPAIRVRHETIRVGHDPWFEREQQAGSKCESTSGLAIIGYVWVLMHRGTDAVTAKIKVDLVSSA